MERQRQATRPGLAVRGTFSPARAWRPAVVARLARTLDSTKYVIADQCIFNSRDTFAKLVPLRQRHAMRRFTAKEWSVNLLLVGLQRRTRFNCGSVSDIRSIA